MCLLAGTGGTKFKSKSKFVSINYVTNDAAAFAKILNRSIKNYWIICNQPFSVLFFLQNNILITSLAQS